MNRLRLLSKHSNYKINKLSGDNTLENRHGIKSIIKSSLVEIQRSGERIKFMVKGEPDPSSAILLVGSGRSGTTWISNVLSRSPGIQQIFEPLNPVWDEETRNLTRWHPIRLHPRSYYIRPSEESPQWKDFLERILKGQVRSLWTDPDRTSFFPNRFLIKSIRANLMLGYIYDNFKPKIIYVTRHPCATIYSRLALGWQADVNDILHQEELVEDFLHPWVKYIEKEKDNLGGHAVWWAIENSIAKLHLESRCHLHITYEQLCMQSENKFSDIFLWLGIQEPADYRKILNRPSRQSRKEVKYQSTLGRLWTWSKHLSSEDQKRILVWADRMGATNYDESFLPLSHRHQN